jgi:glycosyltransferase involved in cell wall biosynthesis
MATFNGGHYLKEQIISILNQLDQNDELIISDDGSIDDTIEIANTFNDNRIKVYQLNGNDYVKNFEHALSKAQGKYIFLSDQDDVWLPNKVEVMLFYLNKYDAVVSNCFVVDKNLNFISSFFHKPVREMNQFMLLNTLIKSKASGCCMAFNRGILQHAIPFPNNIPSHDYWIWSIACIYGKSLFIEDKLIFYRRHEHNHSVINGVDLVLEGKSHNNMKSLIKRRFLNN